MLGKAYRLVVSRTATKDLVGLPPKLSAQIERTIDRLRDRLRRGQRPQDMKGVHGGADTYRIDRGENRVLFELDK